MKNDQPYPTISALQAALATGETTTVATVNHYLKRIEAATDLNIYVEVWAEEALQEAERQDTARADGKKMGQLAGVVVSLKDVLCYAEHRVSAASKMLKNFVSPYSATAVERLLKEDAIIIGRTNCDEFAMGSGNENTVYGPTKNAADPDRVPGGSSGGAAVSVQAGTCLIAVGSSTGGSVRQPASFCGLYGLKPTYGRVSRHGLIAYGSSFDVIGLLGREPADLALVLSVIAGADEFDSTAPNRMVPRYDRTSSEGPKKIAYFPDLMHSDGIAPGIKTDLENTLEDLKEKGHELVPVTFDLFDYVVPAYYVLTTAEASSNLSRFDGLRYGYRHPEANSLEETYRKSRSEGFGLEVQRRILLGAFVLSSGYYDAYYERAQKVRRLIRDRLMAILSENDFILMPVSPSLPWKIGAQKDDPVANYLADIYTVLANLAGLPAMAIPTATGEQGLPLGYQLMAANWNEAELLAFAERLKKA
ncbi:Asp-tRNA(Asn)/Glu-tRNA(Gln) amidotransferase GatCAB subunit A [Lewinellaceae bacterium SD302]|nr:Asp-tRNA(Asn)/Glu-tRNA(Gln) amidotransferase GatCAB subunit A [Lewinellaceae bacterium SD302]